MNKRDFKKALNAIDDDLILAYLPDDPAAENGAPQAAARPVSRPRSRFLRLALPAASLFFAAALCALPLLFRNAQDQQAAPPDGGTATQTSFDGVSPNDTRDLSTLDGRPITFSNYQSAAPLTDINANIGVKCMSFNKGGTVPVELYLNQDFYHSEPGLTLDEMSHNYSWLFESGTPFVAIYQISPQSFTVPEQDQSVLINGSAEPLVITYSEEDAESLSFRKHYPAACLNDPGFNEYDLIKDIFESRKEEIVLDFSGCQTGETVSLIILNGFYIRDPERFFGNDVQTAPSSEPQDEQNGIVIDRNTDFGDRTLFRWRAFILYCRVGKDGVSIGASPAEAALNGTQASASHSDF